MLLDLQSSIGTTSFYIEWLANNELAKTVRDLTTSCCAAALQADLLSQGSRPVQIIY